ncbi:hypothetical protein [Streptomyces sp. NBC_01216]|uniref:hypothetical protein n=1 Tax=unclassified Streptomyces TaxID=2593676 RepID=UPI002E107687|nr:hypothetical protein OG393_19135 [Streptomyces sp. NBC_01216]
MTFPTLARTPATLRRLAALAAGVALTAGCAAGGVSVDKANDELRSTSFHGRGSTTALGGGSQEIWSDPDQGLRIKASGASATGEMYCKDGKTYTSAPMFADALKQRGQAIDLPERLADVFVTTETGQGCDVYFVISDSAEHAPESDKTFDGRRTTAFSVSSGAATDTYYLESESSRLVRLEAERDGRTSTTRYDSFGEKFTITMPDEDKTMPMDDFRREVMGG